MDLLARCFYYCASLSYFTCTHRNKETLYLLLIFFIFVLYIWNKFMIFLLSDLDTNLQDNRVNFLKLLHDFEILQVFQGVDIMFRACFSRETKKGLKFLYAKIQNTESNVLLDADM